MGLQESGKTHLAVAIAKRPGRIAVGSVTFWSVPDLLDNLRNTYLKPERVDVL